MEQFNSPVFYLRFGVLISYCQDEMALSAPGKGSGPVMYGKIATPRGDAS